VDAEGGFTIDARLKVVTGLTGVQRRLRRRRAVLNEHYGPVVGAPVGEQSTNVVFARGVVARPPIRIEETVLYIDDDENCG
jgi:hypothetical protein